jgi:hypothetical protein
MAQQNATAAGRETSAGLPGLLPAAVVAVLSGIGCWLWLTPAAPPPAAAPNAGDLAEVSEQDITGALGTMAGSDAVLAQFKQREAGCRVPLAWVTVAHAPGQPDPTVRIHSGGYMSPPFEVTATPRRIAIPYPGPYLAGHGILGVLSTGGAASIAIIPPWNLPPQPGEATHAVTWHPTTRCAKTNG